MWAIRLIWRNLWHCEVTRAPWQNWDVSSNRSSFHKALQRNSQYIMPRMPLFLLDSYLNDLKKTMSLNIYSTPRRWRIVPSKCQKLKGISLTRVVLKTREKGVPARPWPIASEEKSCLREGKPLPLGTCWTFWSGWGQGEAWDEATGQLEQGQLASPMLLISFQTAGDTWLSCLGLTVSTDRVMSKSGPFPLWLL